MRLRKVLHIREMVPYTLGDVLRANNDQMAWKNRIRVHLDAVAPPLPSLEGQVELLRRTVFAAQEAGTGAERFRAYIGRCRDGTERIVLNGSTGND